jgi:hypothetical protein
MLHVPRFTRFRYTRRFAVTQLNQDVGEIFIFEHIRTVYFTVRSSRKLKITLLSGLTGSEEFVKLAKWELNAKTDLVLIHLLQGATVTHFSDPRLLLMSAYKLLTRQQFNVSLFYSLFPHTFVVVRHAQNVFILSSVCWELRVQSTAMSPVISVLRVCLRCQIELSSAHKLSSFGIIILFTKMCICLQLTHSLRALTGTSRR